MLPRHCFIYSPYDSLELAVYFGVFTLVECLVTTRGAEYRGRRSHTSHDRPCQRWDVQQLHSIDNFRRPSLFPGGSVHAAQNFCRNPGGTRQHPWCFVTSEGTFWEYCDIPMCGTWWLDDLCFLIIFPVYGLYIIIIYIYMANGQIRRHFGVFRETIL